MALAGICVASSRPVLILVGSGEFSREYGVWVGGAAAVIALLGGVWATLRRAEGRGPDTGGAA